jgi:hypothetical protein
MLALASFARPALAQQEAASSVINGEEEAPAKSASHEVVVEGGPRSPSWTQSRTFTGTRFWRLDPGQQEFEVWYTGRLHKDGDVEVNRHLWQIEYMVSLIRGVQLDVYANYQYDAQGGPHIEGAQIETRIAPWRYGQIFGNPTLYLEWHPRNRDANRGEVRLLFGGQLGIPHLRGAMNLLWEQNLDSATGKKVDYITDREVGATGAIAYELVPHAFSVGAEGQFKLDQQGEDAYQRVVKAGPSFWFSFMEGHFHLTVSALIGLTSRSDRYYPIAILGYRP